MMAIYEKIDLKGLSTEEEDQLLPERLLLLGYRGSITHGTYRPQENPHSIDDRDIMGTFAGPVSHYLGFRKKNMESKDKAMIGPWDAVHHEVRKFVGMLLGCNPNVIQLLWIQPKHIIYSTDEGDLLRKNRDIFTSKEIYHSFRGYAYSQLDRMKKSRRNIDEVKRLEKLHQRLLEQGKDPDNIEKPYTGIEQEYKKLAQKYYSGYMSKERRRKVRKFGYDTKNASHLIRILEMGKEFLLEEQLRVERPNARELVSIKRGEWEFDDIIEQAQNGLSEIEDAYKKSSLPAKGDRDKAERLVMNILGSYFDLNIPRESEIFS